MRKPRLLKDCPACLGGEEALEVFERGKVPREHFRPRDGWNGPRMVVVRILCWWCRDFHHPEEVSTCMATKRPAVSTNGDSTSSWTAKMPSWLSDFPEIWEFLSKGSYADGAPRQLGKVSLALVSGGIQVTLTDPSSSAYFSRQYQTVEDALLSLEIGLKEGSLSWRPSGPPKGKKGR